MNSVGQLKSLHKKYGNEVQFLFIYCREAHAIDGARPGSRVLVEEPISTQERRDIAKKFVDDQQFGFPALLDAIDDKTGTDYAAHPDRLYLVGKDGKLAWVGDQGPRGFRPSELETAILAETQRGQANLSGTPERAPSRERGGPGAGFRPGGANGFRPGGFGPGGARGGPGGARLLRMLPVINALDANQDGEISSQELDNAVAALKQLDKDNNGKLTLDELAPSFGGRGGFGGGRGGPNDR